jgi:Flp pilus assembly protein TadG
MSVGGPDRGSTPVEVAIIAPAVLALLMLVIFAGRVAQAEQEVQQAAAAAARAASQRSGWTSAAERADDVAEQNLTDAGISCDPFDVALDPASDLSPGGHVTVIVSCTTTASDLVLLAFPGDYSFSTSSTEVIDTFRGQGP